MLNELFLILSTSAAAPLAGDVGWVASGASIVLPGQDDLEEVLAAYKKIVKGREGHDQIIQHLDGFVQRYAANRERLLTIEDAIEFKEGDMKALKAERKTLGKEQKSLSEAVWYSFSRKQSTADNLRVWKTAVFAFSQMGEHGSDFLWKVFEDKRFRKEDEFRALCVERIGYTHDYGQYKELIDMLDYHNELIIAAAGNALAQFGDAPGKVRKETTEKLVKFLESYYNASTNFEDVVAVRIYRQVRQPLIDALTALTGQSFRDPLDWTKWWNKNKNKKDVWSDPA